jgi:predicted transcriptional regulator
MTNPAILMSIRPLYAEKIFNRTKTVELRRIKPKLIHAGSLIFVYVSSPIKSLVGAFSVASVTEGPILALWESVKDHAGISYGDFHKYYHGAETGVAIFINDVWLLPKPIHLSDLQKDLDGFYPPQSFRYTSIQQVWNFR